MTIEQIYNWAKENNVENVEVVIQYRDEGGDYFGADEEIRMSIGYYNKHHDYVDYSGVCSDEKGYKKVVIL